MPTLARPLPFAALALAALACSLSPGAAAPTNLPEATTVSAIVQPTRTPVGAVAELPAGWQPTPLEVISDDVQSSGVTDPTRQARVAENISNPACPVPNGWTLYTVAAGDSIYRLSQTYDTTVDALQQGNCLVDARYIEVGQVIVVPGEGAPAFISPAADEDTSDTRASAAPTSGAIPVATADTTGRILAAPETVTLYLVMQQPADVTGSIPVGCGSRIAPAPQTVYGADSPENRVRASLEALFDLEDTPDGFNSPVSERAVTVDSVRISTGVATVALSGEIIANGACEIPLLREQIKQTILADSAVNEALVTLNGASIDEAFSQR